MMRAAPPCCDNAAGDFGGQRVAPPGGLENRSLRGLDGDVEAARRYAEGRCPAASRPTTRSRHTPSSAHELPDRQGIEELVGDEEERAVVGRRRTPNAKMVRSPKPRESRPVALSGRGSSPPDERRAALENSGARARDAKDVGHQRAAAGAELDQPDGRGAPASRQASTSQAPTISPNIWLTSGAVTKSPATPKGSRVM